MAKNKKKIEKIIYLTRFMILIFLVDKLKLLYIIIMNLIFFFVFLLIFYLFVNLFE